jgi:hypothetical protein
MPYGTTQQIFPGAQQQQQQQMFTQMQPQGNQFVGWMNGGQNQGAYANQGQQQWGGSM